MQIQLSIEMRAGLNEASKLLNMSQLSIIRTGNLGLPTGT